MPFARPVNPYVDELADREVLRYVRAYPTLQVAAFVREMILTNFALPPHALGTTQRRTLPSSFRSSESFRRRVTDPSGNHRSGSASPGDSLRSAWIARYGWNVSCCIGIDRTNHTVCRLPATATFHSWLPLNAPRAAPEESRRAPINDSDAD